MADSYDINDDNEVVPYYGGRMDLSTDHWRDATELELEQRDEINNLEAELEKAQERIKELEEQTKKLLESYTHQFLEVGKRRQESTDLRHELSRRDEEESDMLTIAYMQGSGKTERLKRFARKIYEENKELKRRDEERGKVVYDVTIAGAVYISVNGVKAVPKCDSSKAYTITITEKGK